MIAWSGIGMNYGHQMTSSSYDTSQVDSDYTFLQSIGITRLRIAFPNWTDNTRIANCQDMITRALAKGFYVAWGVATNGTVDSTQWASYKTYITGTLAPWAQSHGLSECSMGNEVELHNDGTTLTSTTVRADIRSMCNTVKAGGYTGKVSYSTSILHQYWSPWGDEGIGNLDYITWNSYDTYTNFNIRNTAVLGNFPGRTYISEFSAITNGYSDYNDESAWYTDVINRVSSMQSTGVQFGYFFTYRDGGFGVTANTFALVLSTGSVRSARDAVKNIVSPKFSGF